MGALWAGVLLLGFDAWAATTLAARPTVTNDFRLLYMAVGVVRDRGPAELYALGAQRLEAAQLGFLFQPFINPPPLLALGAVLSALPFAAALTVWTLALTVVLVAAYTAVAPGDPLGRLAAVVLALGLFPVAFGVMVGQPVAFVTGGLALAWWLLRTGRPAPLAGIALVVIALKPQLGFLVPPALLVSGRLQAALVAIGVLALAALASVAFLGSGFHLYLSALNLASTWELTRRFAVPGLLPTPWSSAVEVLAAAAGLAAAWRLRSSLEAVFAAGISASLLASPYIGIQDLAALALAALLMLRARPPAWQVALILAGYPLAELALALGPAPLLAWRLAWLASLLLLRSDQLDRAVGAGVGATAPA